MNRDQKIGIVTTLLGVMFSVYTYFTIPVTLKTELDPGSQLFPMIACIGLTLCGIGIFAKAQPDKEDDKPYFDKAAWVRFGKLALASIVYLLALKYIGFLFSTPVYLFLLVTWFAYEEKIALWKKLVFSLVMTGAVYFIFVRLLKVYLPSGSLFR